MTACEECGYDFESLDHDEILRAISSLADEHRKVLSSVAADRLRAHPRQGSWSALEYGCHVRDVLRIQRDRVRLAQTEDTPEFVSMRRDEQDPAEVAGQLTAAARSLADTLGGLDDAGWLRTGLYPMDVSAVHIVGWVGQRTAHELAHHLFDCQRLLADEPAAG
jgi:S-DNA-T family DNA segregation ATPase FtsK/SpoIIIE